MHIDPSGLTSRQLYGFMTSVVVPRPIAFVSTVNSEGKFNVAPFSYFNALTSRPPLFGISIGRRSGERKDTLRNIQETGEFVINVVSEDLAERMVRTSGDWPEDVDEFEITGLTPAPSEHVKPPRVGESPVHLECRLYRVIELGATFFVVGELVCAHVEERVVTDGRVDVTKLHPVARLGGADYAIVREPITIERPNVRRDGGGGAG